MSVQTSLVVTAAFDADADVWFVESSDVPGLHLEAPSVEALRNKLPGAILDLLETEHSDERLAAPVDVDLRHTADEVVGDTDLRRAF